MPDDGGFFASHFFNSTKGGGASGNGFVSLQSCTDSWLGCLCVCWNFIWRKWNFNRKIPDPCRSNTMECQVGKTWPKNGQEISRSAEGFPFRALEIRIVLISRYIHIELVVRLFYSIAVTTTILSPHSALKFAKKCNFEKFASKDEIDFFEFFLKPVQRGTSGVFLSSIFWALWSLRSPPPTPSNGNEKCKAISFSDADGMEKNPWSPSILFWTQWSDISF